ncbi:MAG TPA: glutamate formimidoyltransferase [Syntrophomonadaceae bacterium]|nr:glutamate formimidoyltransferase [Syntrophomonadaceae bacterium]
MSQFMHLVPNFSEGRRKEVIKDIIAPLQNVEGIKLIDYYPDPDFNRTIVEVIGQPEPLKNAIFNMTEQILKHIDMEKQRGTHPRIGALDTLSIYPLAKVTLAECLKITEEIGQELYDRFKIPVYFSGENAASEERKNLAFLRKGQYEGLKEAIYTPERVPDIGTELHPTAGATIVNGAASGLVAVNVILNTRDINIARNIAQVMRGPSGGFSTIHAVAFYLEDQDYVAVSMNMFDTDATPIYRAFKVIEFEAARYGLTIVGTQIVGTLPQEALVNCAEYFLKLIDFNREQIIENHLIDI